MPSSGSDQGSQRLWQDYKEMTCRVLPDGTGRFVKSRTFDRLLITYALYSVAVAGALILSLLVWPDLPDRLAACLWQPTS